MALVFQNIDHDDHDIYIFHALLYVYHQEYHHSIPMIVVYEW